jgi:hypothetical protein
MARAQPVRGLWRGVKKRENAMRWAQGKKKVRRKVCRDEAAAGDVDVRRAGSG